MDGRVLIVAGSDSGGGAGIQADIKTVSALGGFAATAVTALTAQDTLAVHEVFAAPPGFVAKQITVVLDDIGADAVKIGMLASAEIIAAVAQALASYDGPLVVDPVMVATSGGRLLADDAVDALKTLLIGRATVVTPNIPEAEVLTGMVIRTPDDMAVAGQAILELGPQAVLMKGGHLEASRVVDLLVTADGVMRFENAKIVTESTHGTGCTLSSAIAVGLAQGQSLPQAVTRARDYVLAAIRLAPGYGRGHGPLNHVDAGKVV
ncbi:bifunctional hydroxymethylpyrimidine kinase/phosphomethylpyrimidine kinase [Govanella unica]|uniref:hydroxymethylpyrimidine kinase n=1 Tax=Govanella unica TaxID=2975056 RepID=A0A9X3TZZ1_9PROT|nr:bifunctional hydroxymethylpyrimidine kinase/phosphomethylpyrimidine kinase [Govania unica]MDA5194923.1 bifunctional hydroxymethylpyrimidine kinase/phosphomethylpyrimidine kinase [Govania unica]